MSNDRVPGPAWSGPPGVRPEAASAGDETHPEIVRALKELDADLPALPLPDHHDRYVAVLDLLHRVLDEARPPG